jgi:tRNA splicing ligase
VAELCQFLGGSWKVITNIQQLSQFLYTINNKERGLILSKQHPCWSGRVQKRAKKRFFFKSENLWLWTNQCNWRAEKRGECADLVQDKTKYQKFQEVTLKFFFFQKILFWHFLIEFFLFCDICTLEELLNASGLRK